MTTVANERAENPLPSCDHCGRIIMPSKSVAHGGTGLCDRPACLADRASKKASTRPRGVSPATKRVETRAEAEANQLARVRAGKSALFLNLLDRTHTPQAPKAEMDGEQVPATITRLMQPPPIVDIVHVPTTYALRRDYTGPVIILDKTAGWVAAINTVDIAHGFGGWQHTGAITLPPSGPIPPGWYEVRISAWHEELMPSPLRATKAAPVGSTVWIAEPLARLLRDLAEADRWGGGELDIVDSYTHPIRVRLDQGGWGSAIRDIRAAVMAEFGDSPEYVAVKRGYSQAVMTMHGRTVAGGEREYLPSGMHRDDITDTVKTMMAVTIWQSADAINRLCPTSPVVALQHTDEIVITPEALAAITTGPHSKGRPRIDESGVKLGTWKTKSIETWGGAQ